MLHHRRRRREPRPQPGEAPGLLAPAPGADPTSLHLIAYDADRLVEHRSADLTEIEDRARGFANVWLEVTGLADIETIQAVGKRYGLHLLTLEDIVQVVQRPKVESYEDYLFIVLRMPHLEDGLDTEQLAIVLGQGFVITFRERPGDRFDLVRRRLAQPQSRMRGRGVDYLAYALMDALIDSHFPIVEGYGERVEVLEKEVLEHSEQAVVMRIHALRREIMDLRRALWALRDVPNALIRDDTPLIQPETRVFLRDCSDHVYQLLDMIEIHREVTSVLLDLYLSSLSARMNEIMKVLTIIATIFMPLGFVASLYGMNFDTAVSPYNMPELRWYYGYPFALAVMAAIALGMLAYFRGKGWIGGGRKRRRRDRPQTE